MSTMDTQKHLYDIIKDFRTAMLVTGSGDGLHARPMHVAELKPDADAFFVASIGSPKMSEIERDPRVLITFQSSSEFAIIEGTASVVRDKAVIDRMWSDAWKVWFPQGKDDPSVCLLKVAATRGEYWDNSGLEGFKYLFEGAKAIFKGRTPQVDEAQHAKVRL